VIGAGDCMMILCVSEEVTPVPFPWMRGWFKEFKMMALPTVLGEGRGVLAAKGRSTKAAAAWQPVVVVVVPWPWWWCPNLVYYKYYVLYVCTMYVLCVSVLCVSVPGLAWPGTWVITRCIIIGLASLLPPPSSSGTLVTPSNCSPRVGILWLAFSQSTPN